MGGIYAESPDKLFVAGFGVGPESAMPTSGTMLELYSMMQQTVVDPAGGGDWTRIENAISDIAGKPGNWNVLCRAGQAMTTNATIALSRPETIRIQAQSDARALPYGNGSTSAHASGTTVVQRGDVAIEGMVLGNVYLDVASSGINNVVIDKCRITGEGTSAASVYMANTNGSGYGWGTEEDPITLKNSILGGLYVESTPSVVQPLSYYSRFVNNSFAGDYWTANNATATIYINSSIAASGDIQTHYLSFYNNFVDIAREEPEFSLGQECVSVTTPSYYMQIVKEGSGNMAADATVNTHLGTAVVDDAVDAFVDPVAQPTVPYSYGDYRPKWGSSLYNVGTTRLDAATSIEDISRGVVGDTCEPGASESPGSPPPDVSAGSVYLYTAGSIEYDDSINLFSQGDTILAKTGGLNLYTEGHESGVNKISRFFPMFLHSSFFRSLPLFLPGPLSGEYTLFSNNVPMYLNGVGTYVSNTLDMIMPNTGYGSGTYVSGGLYLYTTGEGLIDGASVYNKHIDLFLQGGTEVSGQLDLVLLGYGVSTDSIHLYTAGVTGTATSGVDMFAGGADTDDTSIYLFARGYRA
jgi:hypothetical protein